jgi:hypothetical protein
MRITMIAVLCLRGMPQWENRQRKKMVCSERQFLIMVERAGRKLPHVFPEEPMYSACTDGKRS